MIRLAAEPMFLTQIINSEDNQRDYVLHGGGYEFHAVISETGTWVQVLPTEKYSPPDRCVEYVYYDTNSRIGLDAIDEFFAERGEAHLADTLRQTLLCLN